MKILVYEDPHQMPHGVRSKLSEVEFTKERIAVLAASEFRDFFTALSETSTPTIAHVRIKTGNEVLLCRSEVQLVVTSIPEEGKECVVIFGIGFNMDREGGECLECHPLDPVAEKIALKHRAEIFDRVKSLDGWREYFAARFRSILDLNQSKANHLLHIASLCEPLHAFDVTNIDDLERLPFRCGGR